MTALAAFETNNYFCGRTALAEFETSDYFCGGTALVEFEIILTLVVGWRWRH